MDLEAALRRLPLWSGSITVEPLAGGITNVSFKVCGEAGTFVARAGGDDAELGIDRMNELHCARAAARLGVAPPVVFVEPPWTVTAFVAGETLSATALRAGDRLRRAARLLRTVHEAGAGLTGHLRWFSPFLVVRTYLELAHAHGWELPFDAAAVRRTVDGLEARVLPFRPTLCHDDLMPANLIDDGRRLWLIDWEYAGVGHPLFDVAGLASNAELDPVEAEALLAAYLEGSDIDAAQARDQLAVLLPMAALREALWAVVHGARSAIEFDYAAYRDASFARYERAVAALARTGGMR